MSWSSRIGQWSGRFSPFARSPTTEGVPQVNDGDFSYITSDDLKRGDYDDKTGPPRDTDILVLKSKKIAYPVHFAAYSIDRGELLVGNVREQAAKKTGTSDPARIKLLYKGKVLKDDKRSCRAEGLKAGSEIMCTIADSLPDEDDDDDGSDSDDEVLDGTAVDGDKPKRKRNRTRNKKKRGKKPVEPVASEALPVPQVETSRAPTPKPAVPVTPVDKLNAVNAKLQEMLPFCKEFLTNPPSDPAKKEFEHKRLGETILAQVLLKLDAIDTEDPDLRARRKELVKDTQRLLNSLDDAMKT